MPCPSPNQRKALLDFRLGSNADIGLAPVDVRFNSKSGYLTRLTKSMKEG
jgi:hypothetical protein